MADPSAAMMQPQPRTFAPSKVAAAAPLSRSTPTTRPALALSAPPRRRAGGRPPEPPVLLRRTHLAREAQGLHGASCFDLSHAGRLRGPEHVRPRARPRLARLIPRFLADPRPLRPPRSKIRDTINNLVIKSPQTWHTAVGLPFLSITGTVRSLPQTPEIHARRLTQGPSPVAGRRMGRVRRFRLFARAPVLLLTLCRSPPLPF